MFFQGPKMRVSEMLHITQADATAPRNAARRSQKKKKKRVKYSWSCRHKHMNVIPIALCHHPWDLAKKNKTHTRIFKKQPVSRRVNTKARNGAELESRADLLGPGRMNFRRDASQKMKDKEQQTSAREAESHPSFLLSYCDCTAAWVCRRVCATPVETKSRATRSNCASRPGGYSGQEFPELRSSIRSRNCNHAGGTEGR